MPEIPKKEPETETVNEPKTESDEEKSWSEDQRKKKYYYDDDHGYKVYKPDEEE